MKPQALLKDDFKNLLDYQEWLDTAMSNLSLLNRYETARFTQQRTEMLAKDKDWFGENVTYEELAAGVREYKQP